MRNKSAQLSLVFLLFLLLAALVSGQKGGAKGAMRGRGKVPFLFSQKIYSNLFKERYHFINFYRGVGGDEEVEPEEEALGAM